VTEFDDGRDVSYMGLHSSTTNGNLMVRVHEIPTCHGSYCGQHREEVTGVLSAR